MNFEKFDLSKALSGASIGFKKFEGSKQKLVEYVNNFAKNGSGDYLYTGIGSKSGKMYNFNAEGVSKNNEKLSMIIDEIVDTSDAIGVRGDDSSQEAYTISTLLPKDSIASLILNGILSRMSLNEIEGLTPARINQLSEQAYKMALSMINTAAKYREEFGKPEDPATPSENPTPTSNTETYLDKISKAVDSLQKNIGRNESGVFLNNTNEKPLYIQKVGESEGATTIKGNSNLGGGQGNIPIIVDSLSQSNAGAIPIEIKGGLQGQWRSTESETKYFPNKIFLNSNAFSVGLNTSDSSELIIELGLSNNENDGLMTVQLYKDLTSLVNNVGVSTFSLGSSYTGKKLLEVLTKINERLTALEL